MQSSRPFELIAEFNKNGSINTETTTLNSQNCQKSTKTTSSSISGEKLQKQNISGVVSVCSKETSKPSKETFKSDSNKTSKFSEGFSPNYSPFLDTPSFTENLNTYDFVTDNRDVTIKRELFHGNTDVFDFHGSNQSQLRGPTIHDTAFCYDLSPDNSDTNTMDLDQTILEADNKQKKFAKKQKNNNRLVLKIRADKSSNDNFNQDSDNLDTLKQDIQSRKEVIQDLRNKLLNKFDDEQNWIQSLKKVRKSMRPLSNSQSSYVN